MGTFCFALRLHHFLWQSFVIFHLPYCFICISFSSTLTPHTHKHALTLNHPSVKHTHTLSLSITNAICSKFLKIYSKPYFVVWRLFQKSIFSYFFRVTLKLAPRLLLKQAFALNSFRHSHSKRSSRFIKHSYFIGAWLLNLKREHFRFLKFDPGMSQE